MLLARVFDGVTDLVVGFLIDHTHTRWGQARPYEISIVLLWLFMTMIYATPDLSGSAQK